jgi:bacterioferritin
MADRKTQRLLEGLQGDLERELRAMLQYIFQSSVLLGLQAMSVVPHLRQEGEDALRHVAFLCDQIVNLGGIPKLTAPKFSEVRDLKQMLENDLDLEREAILEYRERAKQAELAGEIGLKIRLEELLAEETDHTRARKNFARLGGIARGSCVLFARHNRNRHVSRFTLYVLRITFHGVSHATSSHSR